MDFSLYNYCSYIWNTNGVILDTSDLRKSIYIVFIIREGEVMQKYTGIMIIVIIGYILGLVFFVIGKIGLKKSEKEFSKSNCDISEMEREKRLPYMISEMERKNRRPYLIFTIIGYSICIITTGILMLVAFDIQDSIFDTLKHS